MQRRQREGRDARAAGRAAEREAEGEDGPAARRAGAEAFSVEAPPGPSEFAPEGGAREEEVRAMGEAPTGKKERRQGRGRQQQRTNGRAASEKRTTSQCGVVGAEVGVGSLQKRTKNALLRS
jgi:hypothetical protein